MASLHDVDEGVWIRGSWTDPVDRGSPADPSAVRVRYKAPSDATFTEKVYGVGPEVVKDGHRAATPSSWSRLNRGCGSTDGRATTWHPPSWRVRSSSVGRSSHELLPADPERGIKAFAMTFTGRTDLRSLVRRPGEGEVRPPRWSGMGRATPSSRPRSAGSPGTSPRPRSGSGRRTTRGSGRRPTTRCPPDGRGPPEPERLLQRHPPVDGDHRRLLGPRQCVLGQGPGRSWRSDH